MTTESQKFCQTKISLIRAGLVVLGATLGSIGPLLVVWNLYIDGTPNQISACLLCFAAGYFSTSVAPLAASLQNRIEIGCLALLIGWTIVPVSHAAGLVIVGAGAALLLRCMFAYIDESRTPLFSCEIAIRIGTVIGAIAVLTAFAADAPAKSALALAAGPALLGMSVLTPGKRIGGASKARVSAANRRSFASTLLGTLTFFQYGCEWGLGIWLAIYFIRILGTSPVTALWLETLYFALLAFARALFDRIPRDPGRRVLLVALLVAMDGYLVLAGAESVGEAVLGLGLLASGLAPVHSVTRNILDERFAFEPHLYQRLFLNGVLGATTTGCIFAYVDPWLGLRAIPFVALIASSAVSILQLLLIFEKHLMGSTVKPLTGK